MTYHADVCEYTSKKMELALPRSFGQVTRFIQLRAFNEGVKQQWQRQDFLGRSCRIWVRGRAGSTSRLGWVEQGWLFRVRD